MKKISMVIIVLLSLALFAAARYGAGQKHRCDTLAANQKTLLEEGRGYRIRDSLNAATVGVLTLQADDFRKHFSELNALVRDMNLKLRHVESVSRNSLESRYDISAPVRNTPADASADTPSDASVAPLPSDALSVGYRDAYITLDGVIVDSVFSGTVITYDTLTQVVHRIPRRFLFIRWGVRELRQDIVSSNPHTRITYNRYIRLER